MPARPVRTVSRSLGQHAQVAWLALWRRHALVILAVVREPSHLLSLALKRHASPVRHDRDRPVKPRREQGLTGETKHTRRVQSISDQPQFPWPSVKKDEAVLDRADKSGLPPLQVEQSVNAGEAVRAVAGAAGGRHAKDRSGTTRCASGRSGGACPAVIAGVVGPSPSRAPSVAMGPAASSEAWSTYSSSVHPSATGFRWVNGMASTNRREMEANRPFSAAACAANGPLAPASTTGVVVYGCGRNARLATSVVPAVGAGASAAAIGSSRLGGKAATTASTPVCPPTAAFMRASCASCGAVLSAGNAGTSCPSTSTMATSSSSASCTSDADRCAVPRSRAGHEAASASS